MFFCALIVLMNVHSLRVTGNGGKGDLRTRRDVLRVENVKCQKPRPWAQSWRETATDIFRMLCEVREWIYIRENKRGAATCQALPWWGPRL